VTERLAYDLIILGLGTAGAALARAAARRGLRVFGIDSKPLGEAGARWVNGVPRWCFEAAEIDPPRHPELRAEGEGFHMIAGWGPRRVTVPSAGLLEVDMRALVARLQAEAAAAGATLRGELRATGLVQAGAGWSVALSSGERVEAALVVDAAGLGGCGIVSSHRPDRRDLCVAAQAVHEIADIDAAKAFFAKHNVPVGDAAVFTGVAGGYSIVNVRADISQRAAKDGDAPPTISILTGAIPGRGHTPGTVLLERFLEANPWIGPRIFGGARAIPIGPPAGALFEGGVLRVGDAAGMVFAAHGSGIGLHLLVGADLAAHLAAGRSAEAWQAHFHRRFGGMICASVVFARFSSTIDGALLERLLASGLLSPNLMRAGLLQRPMRPGAGDLPGLLIAGLRSPALVRRLAPTLVQMQRLELHHLRVPDGAAELGRWLEARDRLLGGG
jgi:flavin-dependent dehydrogenase